MATLILKATERCNSNCYYCDVVRKAKTGGIMSLDLLEVVFTRINEYLEGNPSENIEILWHGGEPLLLGPQYYRTALEFQEKYCRETNGRITHNIQTNLTCFTEEYVEVFRNLGISSVGTSYDHEPHMRGFGKERDSDSYNKKFMTALGLLERRGFGWGMIYVVTKKSLTRPLEIFFHLTNMRLSGGISFNPVLIYDEERKDVEVTPAEYVEFLGAIFPCWWKNRQRYPGVEPFHSLVDGIIEGKGIPECMQFGVCDSTYQRVNIESDGGVSMCGSPEKERTGLGNIMSGKLTEIFQNNNKLLRIMRESDYVSNVCNGCRLWGLCHGKTMTQYYCNDVFIHRDKWCESRIQFIYKYVEPITGINVKSCLLALREVEPGKCCR